MATKTIVINVCDSCGKEGSQLETLPYSVDIHSRLDAAGSTEIVYGTVDLCLSCSHGLVKALMNSLRQSTLVDIFNKRYGTKMRIS